MRRLRKSGFKEQVEMQVKRQVEGIARA